MTTAMPSSASAMPSRRWPGSSSRARPTERAVDPAPLASTSQPARKPRPTVAPADETADELRCQTDLRNEHDRALTCWRRLAVRKGLDESTARMIGNETWARDEQRRNSSAFKDLEEGCHAIEQCVSEITRLTASGGEGSPRADIGDADRMTARGEPIQREHLFS